MIDPELEKQAAIVGFPPRIFLYTLDQVATCVGMTERSLRRNCIYFEGRSAGRRTKGLLIARNVAPPNEPADWRVAEAELVRWLKHKGFQFVMSSKLIS